MINWLIFLLIVIIVIFSALYYKFGRDEDKVTFFTIDCREYYVIKVPKETMHEILSKNPDYMIYESDVKIEIPQDVLNIVDKNSIYTNSLDNLLHSDKDSNMLVTHLDFDFVCDVDTSLSVDDAMSEHLKFSVYDEYMKIFDIYKIYTEKIILNNKDTAIPGLYKKARDYLNIGGTKKSCEFYFINRMQNSEPMFVYNTLQKDILELKQTFEKAFITKSGGEYDIYVGELKYEIYIKLLDEICSITTQCNAKSVFN